MAGEDRPDLERLVIYEVFVRNHGRGGSLGEVEQDLERIRSLGVDILWLMPIHPIGRLARKGSLGSPYSISDYRAVNSEYGTERDFVRLLARAHSLGLWVMIDVVYNHTSHDSLLVVSHPEWYHRNERGLPVTTVPEWSDVIDLRYPNSALEGYLIDTLLGWSEMGVDGFRCDVAPLVPLDFWLRAREAVAHRKPQTIWLAESVHAAFIGRRRDAGLRAHSDGELYRAFDLEYDYELWPIWQAAAKGGVAPGRYLELLRLQQSLYPAGAVKMRCVENHDQPRIMALAPTRDRALAWTAFQAFNRGAFLIYAGQEAAAARTPSLFDRDPIEWGSYELAGFIARLARLKKEPELSGGRFSVLAPEPVVEALWESAGGCLLGLFNVEGRNGDVEVGLPDGVYEELLFGGEVKVRGGRAEAPQAASVLRCGRPARADWFYSDLLDHNLPPNP